MSLRVIAATCFILPGFAGAQRPDTASIPRELAVALIMMSDYATRREPTVVVGRVPDPGLSRLVPPRARVLGGVTFDADRLGRGGAAARTATIFALPIAPDSALKLAATQLEIAGLKTPPAFEPMGRGGFVATSIGPTGRPAVAYCGDSLSAHVTAAEGNGGNAIVSLITSRSLRYTACDDEVRLRMNRVRREEIELPTLRPPSGASGRRMGMSGSDNSREAQAEYESTLTAVQMVDHFNPQLREQGWTLGNRVSDGNLSVQTATHSKDGRPLFLIMTDFLQDPRTHSLTLRVWRQSQDP
jgi:hypothetical protein